MHVLDHPGWMFDIINNAPQCAGKGIAPGED